MRGLWKALLLAPALVWADRKPNNLLNQAITSTNVDVLLPTISESPDILDVLSFHVEVLASEQICGYGNLTLNGQELSQERVGSLSLGRGSIDVDGTTVVGSWTFSCLDAFDEPYAQRLDFSILSVDGVAVDEITFWLEFKQNEDRRIFSISAPEDDSSSEMSAGDDLMDLTDFEAYDIESELVHLNWMKDVVQEFEYMIFRKEEAMARYFSEGGLDACDSLKCILKNLFSKARMTAHKMITKVYPKFDDDVMESENDMRPPWKEPHWRKPHWGKRPHPPPMHGNHTHGNHTCPGKGNHTRPHPPHRLPHPPPFCRCKPPPRHGHRPPHGPPPHGPPGKPPGDSQDHYSGLPSGDPRRPLTASSGAAQPPPFDGPQNDGPQMNGEPDVDEPSIDGPPFNGMGSLSEFDSPTFGRKLHKIKTAVKFVAVATLLFLLVTVTHRCCYCCSARRKERRARREERRRRRAFRRAAYKHAWKSWFARHVFRSRANDDLEDEEKRAMFASRVTNGQEDAVASEISELSNAANIVSDMIAAEEGRVQGRVSTDSRSSLPDYMSELGGEPLPTYEDEERTELSSMIADGFRYTPGSTEYTPGSSTTGSVRDIIGDVKE